MINKAINDITPTSEYIVLAGGGHFQHLVWTLHRNILTELCSLFQKLQQTVFNLLFIIKQYTSCLFCPPESTPQTASRLVQPFFAGPPKMGFNRIHQIAPMCNPCSTCFLGPNGVQNSNDISISWAVFTQLTAVWLGMPGHVLSPKNCAFARGDLETHLNLWFFGPPESNLKWHLDCFSHFYKAYGTDSLHLTAGRPFRQYNCPIPWGSEPPSNTRFLGPTRILNRNGNSIG